MTEHNLCPVSRSRRSPDQCLLAAPRSISLLCHVLLRLWTPRHPPCTLLNLSNVFDVHVLCSSPCFQRAIRSVSHKSSSWEALTTDEPFAAQRASGDRFISESRFQRCTAEKQGWWRRWDSNPRPPGCKPGALPTELRPRRGADTTFSSTEGSVEPDRATAGLPSVRAPTSLAPGYGGSGS